MCAVSVIMDYGHRFQQDYWTHQTFPPFKRLVDEAKRFDEATGQPHCEDPLKAALLKSIEERLARIEAKLEEAAKP